MFPTLSPYLVPRGNKYYSFEAVPFHIQLLPRFVIATTTPVRSGIYFRALMFNVVGSFSISLTKSQENSIGKRCWMALFNINFPYLIFTDRTTPSLLLLSFMTISYDFSDPMNQHHVSFREMIFLDR